eukprot:COSAG02_NODE_15659_length_1151_cov_0.929658_1_plen_30_part_10
MTEGIRPLRPLSRKGILGLMLEAYWEWLGH